MSKCRICGDDIGPGRIVCSKIKCVRTNYTSFSLRRHKHSRIDFVVYGASGKQLETITVDEYDLKG